MIITKRQRRARGVHGFDRVFVISIPARMSLTDRAHCVDILSKVKGARFVVAPGNVQGATVSSLADTIQRMQIQQLENAVARSEHEIRKAKAEADLAELILRRMEEPNETPKLPRGVMS